MAHMLTNGPKNKQTNEKKKEMNEETHKQRKRIENYIPLDMLNRLVMY